MSGSPAILIAAGGRRCELAVRYAIRPVWHARHLVAAYSAFRRPRGVRH